MVPERELVRGHARRLQGQPVASKKLPALDALRGVAILAVFVQHLLDRFEPFVRARVEATTPASVAPWILTALHHAWWGVDLFFVVSGFSLALGYLDATEGKRAWPRVFEFLKRRATRILPAYLVALGVVLVVHRDLAARPSFAAALAAHLALLQGYVAPGGIVFIGASWSLTTEASFYLLLPLVAPALFRSRRRFLFAAALVAASFALHAIAHEVFLGSPIFEASQRRWITSRLDQFVLGAIAAMLVRTLDRRRAARAAPFVACASIAALVVTFRLEGALYRESFGAWPYALMSMATTTLVLAAVSSGGRLARVLAPKPLAWLGVVSYGVFLFHQLALELAASCLGVLNDFTNLFANASLALALSIAAGALSYRFVERPLLEPARRAVDRRHAGRPNLAHGARG